MKQTLATRQLRDHLDDLLAVGAVERIHDEEGYVERIAPAIDAFARSEEEAACARDALHRLSGDEELTPDDRHAIEAIILPQTRPVLDVVRDTYTAPVGYWSLLDDPAIRAALEAAIPSVGRIELPDDPRLPYGGTGFVVGPHLVMTNRHVAELFASGLGVDGLCFKPGQSSVIDFREEVAAAKTANIHVPVVSVEMIHPYWDMALLRVEGLPEAQASLTLGTLHPEDLNQRNIAVIGYPAFDSRNPADVQNRVFEAHYDVKRLQPGTLTGRKQVLSFENRVRALKHNASTLGGNSGSAVIDLSTGAVVGLHFAGRYKESNYAVPTYELARDPFVRDAGVRFASQLSAGEVEWMARWREVDPAVEADAGARIVVPAAPLQVPHQVSRAAHVTSNGEVVFTVPLRVSLSLGDLGTAPAPVPSLGGGGAVPRAIDAAADEASKPKTEPDPDYGTREGYDADFLNGHYVRMPWLTPEQYDDTARNRETTFRRHVLPYHHFSVVMNKKRRMAFFSAVNIDGKRSQSVNRDDFRDVWSVDPRIPAGEQLENEFYKDAGGVSNPLDRGHLVRRLDPCWGTTEEEVLGAHHDTFHYTNCSPQHASFNRGQNIWLGIENYILKRAAARDLRVSVFSGPVLDDGHDPVYRTPTGLDLQLPTAYWKVVTVVQPNGQLAATGYLLSQETEIDPLIEVPVYGDFNHYQVTVAEIEERTKLWFWGLAERDPLVYDLEGLREGARPNARPRIALARYEDARLDLRPDDGERAYDVMPPERATQAAEPRDATKKPKRAKPKRR